MLIVASKTSRTLSVTLVFADSVNSWDKMSCAARPKSMSHAQQWTDEVENLYRFQQAGYKDETEYKQIKRVDMIDRWPETGYVKKLQRRDNTFYYFNRKRECEDTEVHKVILYSY